MRSHLSIHLLIAATILFSQIVSGIHMAGHVSGHVIEMTNAPASPDSGHGQNGLERSCVIYHIYAGSHCVAASPVGILAGTFLALPQQVLHSAAAVATRLEQNSIRGPPAFS